MDIDLDGIVESVTRHLDAEIARSGVSIGAVRRLELIVRLTIEIVRELRARDEPQTWARADTVAQAMQLFDEATVSALQDFENEQLVRAHEGREHLRLDDLPQALAAARAAAARERVKVEQRLRGEGFAER